MEVEAVLARGAVPVPPPGAVLRPVDAVAAVAVAINKINKHNKRVPNLKIPHVFLFKLLPHRRLLRGFVAVPMLPRAINFSTVGALDDRPTPGVLGQSQPGGIVARLRFYVDDHLPSVDMALVAQVNFVLVLMLICARAGEMVILLSVQVAHRKL